MEGTDNVVENDLRVGLRFFEQAGGTFLAALKTPDYSSFVSRFDAFVPLPEMVKLDSTYNFYALLNRRAPIQVLPSTITKSVEAASAASITAWRFVPLDFDPREGDWYPQMREHRKALPEYLAAIDAALPGAAAAASVCFTGRGLQIWIRLIEQPVSPIITPTNIRRCNLLAMSRVRRELLIPGLSMDTAVADAARIVRLPGSINHRTGLRAEFVHIADGQWDPAPLLEEVLSRVPDPPAATHFTNQPSWMLLPHMTATAARFLAEPTYEGDRHNKCVATARSMRHVGIRLPEARRLLLKAAATLCYPRMSESEVLRIVHSVYR